MFLGAGGIICCFNLYVSHIRYWLHLLKRKPAEQFQWASGIPMIGSFLVIIAVGLARQNTVVLLVAASLLLIDTGGPVWLIGSYFYNRPNNNKTHE